MGSHQEIRENSEPQNYQTRHMN
uniref:Uncharacterized protein n=1 Tax=Anguilla anguilla TaxID=7936 RepID=A0A0E9TQI9_ANGAN